MRCDAMRVVGGRLSVDAFVEEVGPDGGLPPRHQIPPAPTYPDGAPSVFVTGGSSGIGYELCRQLSLKHGFRVFMGAKDVRLGGTMAMKIEDDGGYCEVIECDVRSCLLYTSPSPRDQRGSRMPSSA